MAGLGKVVKFKSTAAGTIAGSGKPSSKSSIEEKIERVLHRLPARIIETPYGKLPSYLVRAIRRSRMLANWNTDLVKAGGVSSRRSGLRELRTAAQVLRRKFSNISAGHREMILEQMCRAASQRMDELPIIAGGMLYEEAALAIGDRTLDMAMLLELLEFGLCSLCSDPRPLTKKQSELDLRRDTILSISLAFEHSGEGQLNKEDLATVARALSPFFPPEAGLASISPSTVRDILRSRRDIQRAQKTPRG